jgi:signal transduction histidine kinase
MFEPFVRGEAEGSGSSTGAGLGLAISQRLAEMMSGAITVDSVPGQGARFTLWLAAAEEPVETGGRTSRPPSPLEAAPGHRPRGQPVE